MKRALPALLFATAIGAYGQTLSPFSFFVHDTTGKVADFALPASYDVGTVATGGGIPTVIRMVNTSASNVYFVAAIMANSAASSLSNPNFTVTGQFQGYILLPGASLLYSLNFAPTTVGSLTGFFNVAYQPQQAGCVIGPNPGNACASYLLNIATLKGTATAPQLVLTYQSSGGPVVLTPSSSSPLTFPNTSLSASSAYTFTLSNPNAVDIAAPAISLPVINTNAASAFTLDTSGIPALVGAGKSASFTVTFAPSQAGLASGVLQVGSNSYPIQGAGVIVASIDNLQISYTDASGVRSLPQSATPIDFGQVPPGAGRAVLNFNLLNPATSSNSVTVSAITVSGTAFSLSGLPALPVTIAPGNSIGFTAAFAPPSSGTYTGGLAIGTRVFSLNGVSVVSSIPGFTLVTSPPTLSSQQQATVTVQLSSPSPVSSVGTITLQFTPSVPGVANDPAIVFLATGGRRLSITLNSGETTARYSGDAAIRFQTGTTAGTITFAVAFPGAAVYNQTFTIPAGTIQLTSTQALRESPNLLVTLVGYDNTYTAGQLSFTFLDTSGNPIGSAIPYDATTIFQNLYFNANTAGGLFSLQASFPVTGDVTKVGSVTVGITNSQGQTTTSSAFQ